MEESNFVTVTANYVLPIGCVIGMGQGTGQSASPPPNGVTGVHSGVPANEGNALYSFPFPTGNDLTRESVSKHLKDLTEMSAVVATWSLFFSEAVTSFELSNGREKVGLTGAGDCTTD